MAYIAFASAKASPGVTTAVAALAATWPADRELVVVELDPAGGDLAVRLDLAPEPGLVSLAAAGRRELTGQTLLAHTQTLPDVDGGEAAPRRVLVGPVSADQAGASLSALRGSLARALGEVEADVLVDCGRLDPASPAYDVATSAALLVMVARPVVAEVHHLAARVRARGRGAVSLLMVGDQPYPVTEVAETVGADPLATLPVDVRAAVALTAGQPAALRALRRSRLLRDARALAEALATWLDPAAPVGLAAPPSPAAPVGPGPAPFGPPPPEAPPPPVAPREAVASAPAAASPPPVVSVPASGARSPGALAGPLSNPTPLHAGSAPSPPPAPGHDAGASSYPPPGAGDGTAAEPAPPSGSRWRERLRRGDGDDGPGRGNGAAPKHFRRSGSEEAAR